MSKPSQEQEIKSQNELLWNLHVATKAARQKLKSLQSESVALSQKLLSQREAELKALEERFKDSMKPLEERKRELEPSISALDSQRSSLESEIVDKKTELKQHTESLVKVQAKTPLESTNLEALKAEQS